MNLSGRWTSRYTYLSSSHGQGLESEHSVIFEQRGTQCTGQSVEDQTESRLSLGLTLDQNIATGIWEEHTSPAGHYHGAVFHGAIQLIISEDGRHMTGQWVGFNSSRSRINIGQWSFTRQS